jgi:RNA polymerase sigma-70 factor (ECF subfamily)
MCTRNDPDPFPKKLLPQREALLCGAQIDIRDRATTNLPTDRRVNDVILGSQYQVKPEGTPDETRLLERIAQKDQQALAELYDRFAKVLFSVLLRLLRNEARAQEVLQDVFVQIWERASSYDARLGKPLTWAVILARNKAIDQLRSMQREGKVIDLLKGFVEESALPPETVHQEVATHELAETMKRALRELPAEQRCAIELAFFQGLTQSEIANELRQPLGTVKARIRRGMLHLRSSLQIHRNVCES